MAGKLLTTGSTVQCPHGGTVQLTTANAKVGTKTGKALLETDQHLVSGCSFTIGNKPSPCLRVKWSAGAGKVKVNSTAVLVKSSSGLCYNAEGAPQGPASIQMADSNASGQ